MWVRRRANISRHETVRTVLGIRFDFSAPSRTLRAAASIGVAGGRPAVSGRDTSRAASAVDVLQARVPDLPL